MSDYGVTNDGFVIKRMDAVLDEIHSDLTDGFGFDTRSTQPSFLDVLVTTFAGQIADLWEAAQDSYYAKYPYTAEGKNLDNAVQYGGIKRKGNKRTIYPLHCTGDNGTIVREDAVVATTTKPEMKLFASREFVISKEHFNKVVLSVVSVEKTGNYSVTINGDKYDYTNNNGDEAGILNGLKAKIVNENFDIAIDDNKLKITDKDKSRSNSLILSDNLTTDSVTSIANFSTEKYGKIDFYKNTVEKMVTNVPGFTSVTNELSPVYGRLEETDVELRHSYIRKSALRSTTMIDSIVSELLNNVANVESATGSENHTDVVDERGLAPHSIEIVVEGGNDIEIASAILRKKAGGIQTNGKIVVNVPGNGNDTIPIRFNRPEYLFIWLKIVLHGEKKLLPLNYSKLVIESIMRDGAKMIAGKDLLIQPLTEGIYKTIAGVKFVDVLVGTSNNAETVPGSGDYKMENVLAKPNQKLLISSTRIEVSLE